MPIKRKVFDSGKFNRVRHYDKMNHPVVKLLKTNKNFAFTVKEICARTKIKSDSVRRMLRILTKKEKVVVHKSPYFAWK